MKKSFPRSTAGVHRYAICRRANSIDAAFEKQGSFKTVMIAPLRCGCGMLLPLSPLPCLPPPPFLMKISLPLLSIPIPSWLSSLVPGVPLRLVAGAGRAAAVGGLDPDPVLVVAGGAGRAVPLLLEVSIQIPSWLSLVVPGVPLLIEVSIPSLLSLVVPGPSSTSEMGDLRRNRRA